MSSFKSKLKNNKIIHKTYDSLMAMLNRFFPKKMSHRLFKKQIGTKMNDKNPQTLNEKLMFYKFNLYWNNELVNICADKYRVRDYVKKCGCGEILNPLYGVYKSSKEIDWENLPEQFAIKCNHGSGFNIICKDKKCFDQKGASIQLDKWLKKPYGYKDCEQGIYYKIPRRIIAEEYIKTSNGIPPNDYKFFCSYGNVYLVFVASDRYEGKTKFDYYTPEWEWIDVKNAHPNAGPMEKPENYDKMLEYASKLSASFPLIRVDFYNEQGKIIFGELTFTHFGCVHPFTPGTFDLEFGKLFPDVKNANTIINNDSK